MRGEGVGVGGGVEGEETVRAGGLVDGTCGRDGWEGFDGLGVGD